MQSKAKTCFHIYTGYPNKKKKKNISYIEENIFGSLKPKHFFNKKICIYLFNK